LPTSRGPRGVTPLGPHGETTSPRVLSSGQRNGWVHRAPVLAPRSFLTLHRNGGKISERIEAFGDGTQELFLHLGTGIGHVASRSRIIRWIGDDVNQVLEQTDASLISFVVHFDERAPRPPTAPFAFDLSKLDLSHSAGLEQAEARSCASLLSGSTRSSSDPVMRISICRWA
jgi:hypothetical protein